MNTIEERGVKKTLNLLPEFSVNKKRTASKGGPKWPVSVCVWNAFLYNAVILANWYPVLLYIFCYWPASLHLVSPLELCHVDGWLWKVQKPCWHTHVRLVQDVCPELPPWPLLQKATHCSHSNSWNKYMHRSNCVEFRNDHGIDDNHALISTFIYKLKMHLNLKI